MAVTPKVADTFKLSADFGSGPGSMSAGATVTVEGIYEPGTPGLGASHEDTVVSKFVDDDGANRLIALPVSQFRELFVKAGK